MTLILIYYKAKLFETYLNIKNPLVISDGSGVITKQQIINVISKGNREWFFNSWINTALTTGTPETRLSKNEVASLSMSEKIDRYAEKISKHQDQDILAEMTRAFKGEAIIEAMESTFGTDGVKYTDRFGDIWVAWHPEQIKETTNKNPTSNLDVRYSVREIVGASGKNYGTGVYLDSDRLAGMSESERKDNLKRFVRDELAGKHFVAYDNNNDAVDIRIAQKSEYIRKKNGKKRYVIDELAIKNNNIPIKQETVVLIDELVASASYESTSPSKYSHDWLDNYGQNDWDYWTVFIQEKNNSVWEATLNIANTKNGEKILYDIDPIKMVEDSVKSVSTTTIDSISDSTAKSQEKFSLREISDITTSDYMRMYHHFGSTNNYNVAGYLLENGVMLDFSGKHWGDKYSTSRQVDHRDIQEVIGNRDSTSGINAMIDMIGNGNIRLMPETGGINLAVKPNATQMLQLRGYITHFKGEVIIDIDEVGGDTIHSWEYPRGTSASKILSDLKAYFDDGTVPKRQTSNDTDIRQFLFSDRDPESTSPRNLLANALEGTVSNDVERKKLTEYKNKIDLMNAEEEKLTELRKQIKEASFSKGKRDSAKLKQLKEDATKTANRINTYDRQLLNLESTTALMNVLEREKKKATERQKQKDLVSPAGSVGASASHASDTSSLLLLTYYFKIYKVVLVKSEEVRANK